MEWFEHLIPEIDKLGIVLGTLGLIVGWFLGAWRRLREIVRRRRWTKVMRSLPNGDCIAVAVRVGGSSNMLPDVKRYLAENNIAASAILSYDRPGQINPDQHALVIAEDLRDGLRDYVMALEAKPIMLFVSGMVPIPFLLGTVLGNTSVVHLHVFENGSYKPFFAYHSSFKSSEERLAKGHINWTAEPLNTSTLPTKRN